MLTIDAFQAGIIQKQREKHGQITVKEVARSVGKTTQTFYFYFKGIPEAMRL